MIKKRLLVVTFTLLFLAAGSPAWAQQFARPDDTLDPGLFSVVGAPSHHAALAEASPASTNEYIDSGVATPTTAQLSLSSVTDPGVDTGHVLRFNCKVEGSKGPETCDVALYDGAQLIYSVSQQPTTRGVWETFSFTLLNTEANLISTSGYANLTVHLTAGISNKASDGDSAQFSWVELEVPAPATTTPSVTTNGAPVFTQDQATLGGNVSSDGGDPLLGVGVYLHTAPGAENGTRNPMTVPAAPYPKDFSGTIGSLSQGTTYYYKAYAENSIGETIADNEVSFTTWDVPTLLATPTKDNIQATSATLGGRVTGDGGEAVDECGVVWSDQPAPDRNDPSDFFATAISCDTGVDFTVSATSLQTGTTYYFRSYATNAVGTAYSAEEGSFVPSGPPQLSATVDLGTVTDTQALLGGNITDNGGSAITAVGIYWDTDGIDTRNDGTHVPMTVTEPSFNQIVTGLPPGSTIYFFAYATNGAGTTDSTIINFDTQAGAPTMDPTPTVANIVAKGATLGGTIIADGGGANLNCGVEWTTVPGEPYESSQSFEGPPDNGTCVEGSPFAVTVSGLTSGQTYYFRAWATSDAGSDVSNEVPFVPQAAPIVTSAAALDPTHNSAILGGEVTSDEGSFVTEHGIVWDTNPNPEAQLGTRTIVPMGTGTGTFSQTVSLPSGDRIYFEAYATNSVGTTYSNQERFVDTATEPTVQASNLIFEPFGGSVRVSWTRGNGDGSLVAVWQDPPNTIDAPVDFTDYAADPNYGNTPPPPETSTNSGNFVVYKGSNNTILVHGLELNTTYNVAVYEYAGLGVNSDYIQTNPATGPVTTGDTPIHNYDYGIDCEQCHMHGSIRPRQDELETKCKTCHTTDEVAQNRQEFANHVLPQRNPDIDFVDCGMCHELHRGALTYTRGVSPHDATEGLNKSFLRTNVTKYVPNAAEPAILRDANDQPKRVDGNPSGYAPAAADTPNRAVEGADATNARGYCQVCHTMTAYHRNNPADPDVAADHGKNGKMQCHDGGTENLACTTPPEVHCGDCHEHNNKFQGVNSNVPCENCHDQPQPPRPVITTQFDTANVLSSHIPNGTPTKPDCVVCHGDHGHGGSVPGFDADTGTLVGGTSTIPTTATGAGEVFEPHCMSCHEDASADILASNGDADHTPSSPFIGATQFPIIDQASWDVSAHDRPTAVVGSTAPVSCVGDGANGCHGSGHGSQQPSLLAPATGATQTLYTFCVNCHDGSVASLDITLDFTGPTMTETSGSKALINTRHDVTTEDQAYSGASLTCADCHNPHADPAGVSVSDLMTGTTLRNYSPNNSYDNTADLSPNAGTYNFSYNGGGNLDPINPEGMAGGLTQPDMIQYCLVCHDGNGHLPDGVVQDANMTDIANAWSGADVHGAGNATGVGSSVNKGGMKFPYVTAADDALNYDPSANYAAMNCTTCHGAHGSENIFNLRTSITVGGVQMEIGGNGNMPIPARITDPTYYDLPRTRETARNSGIFVQEDHYWGAWCTFCHKMDGGHPAKVEIDSCTNGHMHGGGAF